MKKIVQRLCLFCVSLPLFFCVVWFTHWRANLLLQLVALASSFLSLCELHSLLSSKVRLPPKEAAVAFPMLLPAASVLCSSFGMSWDFAAYVFALVLALEVFYALFFSRQGEKVSFEERFFAAVFGIFFAVYPGFFLSFFSRIAVLPHSREFLLALLALDFGCDSGAWFFGVLFGKKNRGIVEVSPNKSVAGFLGGFFVAILIVFGATRIFPDVFRLKLWQAFVLAVSTALAGMVGDLFASLIKRFCGAKDSGNIIPGRGGILDCVDSVALSAPIYYFLIKFMLKI